MLHSLLLTWGRVGLGGDEGPVGFGGRLFGDGSGRFGRLLLGRFGLRLRGRFVVVDDSRAEQGLGFGRVTQSPRRDAGVDGLRGEDQRLGAGGFEAGATDGFVGVELGDLRQVLARPADAVEQLEHAFALAVAVRGTDAAPTFEGGSGGAGGRLGGGGRFRGHGDLVTSCCC